MTSFSSFISSLPFTPSSYQNGVFKAIASTNDNLFVGATAGSGKTTTILQAVKLIRGMNPNAKCLFLAFNKKIADELGRKIDDPMVKFSTFHSAGFSLLRGAGLKQPNGRGMFFKVADSAFARLYKEIDSHSETRVKGVTRGEAKAAHDLNAELLGMIALVKSLLLNPNDSGEVARACAAYDKPFSDASLNLLPSFMKADAEMSQKGFITFDDMLYLPVIWGVKAKEAFDFILIDEAQDMNAVQEKFLNLITHDKTRIVAVGDKSQAIYGFRGSNVEAVESLIKTYSMKELPLSICYRCPTSHIERARAFCAAIEPAPNASEGIFNDGIPVGELVNHLKEGDMVIARCNAPLVTFALQVVAQGRKATVAGSDFGQSLINIVESFDAISVSEVLEKLAIWHQNETERAMKRQMNTQGIDDKKACIEILLSGCDSLQAYIDRVCSIFNREGFGVLFSTVHKAKGLECDNVFFLEDNFQYKEGEALQWQIDQLRNLRFVAYTRAKRSLSVVVIEGPSGRGGKRRAKAQAVTVESDGEEE